MRLAIALIAALVAGTVSAEPMPWMKKDNPDELIVEVVAPPIEASATCPSWKQVIDTVDGVFVRSRIKPMPALPRGPRVYPTLLVASQCDDEWFKVQIDFLGRGEDGYRYRFDVSGYGGFGRSSRPETVLDAVRSIVEAAITDYLKANFDL